MAPTLPARVCKDPLLMQCHGHHPGAFFDESHRGMHEEIGHNESRCSTLPNAVVLSRYSVHARHSGISFTTVVHHLSMCQNTLLPIPHIPK